MAEGAIYDFFDKDLHVVRRPPKAAEYWISAVDYGTINAFCCLLIGVNSGKYDQQGRRWWVEKEYYWDSAKQGRQKTNGEYANDVVEFLEPYGCHRVYIDPSAAAFKEELRRRNLHPIDSDNDVDRGVQIVGSEIQAGNLVICESCPNLIREIQGYVWDSKAAKKGWDEPLKVNDHAVDALRYGIATHKIPKYYK
jgi:hypothetical protein